MSINFPLSATRLKLTIFATFFILTERCSFGDHLKFHYNINGDFSKIGLKTTIFPSMPQIGTEMQVLTILSQISSFINVPVSAEPKLHFTQFNV